MKIIHVINSMSTACGGPARTTLLTLRGLRDLGMDAKLLTNRLRSDDTPVSNEPFIDYLPLPHVYYSRWGYSAAFGKALERTSETDIYHIQGLWQYQGYVTARFALENHRPYVITLHGTLHPGALRYSSFIKKITLFLFQSKQLKQAACIHVTCMKEMENYRLLGFTNPIAVIPNPIECSEPADSFFRDGVKRVGYLGRIQPYKRIDRLIEVWRNLNEPGELVIIGDGDPDYVLKLRGKVKEAGLRKVRFTGWVSGKEKQKLLASLTCLVVPSDFENFGMIVPEALLQEVPVIASTGSPWEELDANRCGWWVDNDVGSLTETVRKALSLDKGVLQEMGRRGRKLVLDKYSVDVVSRQMTELYNWILNKQSKPNFIFEK
ncbi:glycosyltransferase [uncultured Parabacteroides sp.]|uniref:glycosyltransferase n=1 Tax=uncultured Parabacteroides sp. TaxID=512312 RepID=UPI00259BE461|nr:glycosyltransferase [uncultured Parabacteroides sp.]